jgi:hypothetical protein
VEAQSGTFNYALDVVRVAPELFSANADGRGVAAALFLRVSADGSRSTEPVFRFDVANTTYIPVPIRLDPEMDQIFLLLFGTGIRGYASRATVLLGGEVIPTLGAGPQGEFVGLDQVNVGPLPRLLSGRRQVELLLFVDGKQANTVTFDIQ